MTTPTDQKTMRDEFAMAAHLKRLRPADRIRSLLDERRWRDYVRVPGSPSIFYRWQGGAA